MADINVERKGPSIWPWIIGLIAVALLIWLLAEMFGGDDDEVVEPVATEEVIPAAPVAPPPEPVAQGPLTIADLLGDPATYIGQTVSPEAVTVVEAPTDRGFWIEDQGERIFVIVNESTESGVADVQGEMAEMPDLNPGDMIQITEAVAQDPTFIDSLQGPISDETREILEGLPVYLVTNVSNIQQMRGAEM